MRGESVPYAVAHMTWDAVGRVLDRGAAAILPIGAGAKQHGLHLPMNTDQLQAEWLATRVAERLDALIWPTLSYGHYPAFVAYAGSVSVSAATFEAIAREIVAGLLDYGAVTVLLLNTGLSTIEPIDRAIAGFDKGRVCHLQAYAGPRFRRALTQVAEGAQAGHADEIETSCMLAIAPDQVVMVRAEASRCRVGDRVPGPLTPHDPASLNYSRSGTLGDAGGSSGAKGELLLNAMVADLIETATAVIAKAPAAAGTAARRDPPTVGKTLR